MDPNELTRFYDDLKSRLNDDKPAPPEPMMHVGYGNHPHGPGLTPNGIAWRNKALKVADGIKDDCRKRILVDIYCKVLPLDDDYKTGHMGMIQSDVDSMLTNKGLSATQYLTSAAKETRAPLLEYVLRATDLIGKQYMEKADEKLRDATNNNIDLPEPSKDNEDNQETEDMLMDVKDDMEYDTFVDRLKKMTIDQIVNDVTAIIKKEKTDNDMEFHPNPEGGDDLSSDLDTDSTSDVDAGGDMPPIEESAVAVVLNYLQKHAIMESAEITPEKQEDMIGIAIRESTLNEIDKIFKMPGSDFRSFSTRIRLGKGVVAK